MFQAWMAEDRAPVSILALIRSTGKSGSDTNSRHPITDFCLRRRDVVADVRFSECFKFTCPVASNHGSTA